MGEGGGFRITQTPVIRGLPFQLQNPNEYSNLEFGETLLGKYIEGESPF